MKHQAFLLLPFLMISPLRAEEATPTEAANDDASVQEPAQVKKDSSYGFGYNNGLTFKQQMSRFGLQTEDLDRTEFVRGFMDALDNKEPANGQEALNNAMLALRNQIQEREKVLAAENLLKATEFLESNKERQGVVTTESGLQYEVLKSGDGESYNDEENTKFLVNYKGSLMDGTEFDSSPEGSPVTMTLNVVPGFREALTTMPTGAKWKIFLKPELGYGEQRRSAQLAPNSLLIFEVELVEMQKPAPRPKAVSKPIQIPQIPTPGE